MTPYINKAELEAEIKRRIEAHKETLKNCDSNISEIALKGSMSAYQSLLHFLNTIKVKEVDLDKEIELIKGDYEQVDVAWNNDFDFIARHFFELGFQAKTDKELVEEVYSHIDSIKDTADRMTSGNFR